jgi:hypothetical protein
LSPATSRIAGRYGPETNKIRTSVLPLDQGEAPLNFLIFEPVIVPASGRPGAGPERLSA